MYFFKNFQPVGHKLIFFINFCIIKSVKVLMIYIVYNYWC